MSRIANRLSVIALCLLVLSASARSQTNLTTAKARAAANPVNAPAESDRMKDGLVGPVRRVRTEVAKLSSADGRPVESKHLMLEIASYDVKGNKVENQYFPIAGATLTGKEVYKYDDKGNISEMTLLNGDGSLLSRESYKYEYDFAGNWNKMTTSVAVVDGGRLTFEPTEVTYRSIMYYLDENMVKMVTPAATTTAQPTSPVAGSNVIKPGQSNTSSGTKLSDNRKTSPVLPVSNMSGVRLSGSGSVEIKAGGINPNQDVALVALDSEPPPSPGPRPLLKPVSGGVLNGTAVSLPPPVYPETAKRMRTSGVVSVQVVLDEIGKVVSATAVSGPSVLRDAAVQAALKARFSPTKLSGQPVKVSGVINYKFALVQ
jgi:TonB family protein